MRNHAVGVNPVDTYLRSNTDNRGPKLPYTPGGDAAGVVEAVGAGVTAVKPGDRVYVGGTVDRRLRRALRSASRRRCTRWPPTRASRRARP